MTVWKTKSGKEIPKENVKWLINISWLVDGIVEQVKKDKK